MIAQEILDHTGGKELAKPKFTQGDAVVMHTCGEAAKYDGRLWHCKTDSFLNAGGHEVVFLDDFSGSFSANFLQKVNL